MQGLDDSRVPCWGQAASFCLSLTALDGPCVGAAARWRGWRAITSQACFPLEGVLHVVLASEGIILIFVHVSPDVQQHGISARPLEPSIR